jgi:hypothetical protein
MPTSTPRTINRGTTSIGTTEGPLPGYRPADGVAFNEDGRTQAGMGVDAGDYDNDGLFDLHVTNFSHDYNTLYRNPAPVISRRELRRRSRRAELPLPRLGSGFQDFDRDGFLDIFVANGHVYPEVAKEEIESDYAQRSLLFRNLGDGRFEEMGGGRCESSSRPRRLSVISTTTGMSTSSSRYERTAGALRNETATSRHWIRLRPSAVTALATLWERDHGRKRRAFQIREVEAARAISARATESVFGLGSRERVIASIRWPSGNSGDPSPRSTVTWWWWNDRAILPPTMVSEIPMSRKRAGSQVRMSSSRTTRSASFPGSSVPLTPSSKVSAAPPRVIARRASSRDL